jgi:hypothetical protein
VSSSADTRVDIGGDSSNAATIAIRGTFSSPDDTAWHGVAMDGAAIVERLQELGVRRGTPIGLVLGSSAQLSLATVGDGPLANGPVLSFDASESLLDVAHALAAADLALRPRWVVWSAETLIRLVEVDVRLATCWVSPSRTG